MHSNVVDCPVSYQRWLHVKFCTVLFLSLSLFFLKPETWSIFEMWDSLFFIVVASQMQVGYLWLGEEFQTTNVDPDRMQNFFCS